MAEFKLNFKDPRSLNEVELEEVNDGFPIDALSPELQKIINAKADKSNFVPEIFAGYLLGVISSAIGNSCRVQVMEGWLERAILYIVCVGNSGVMKSEPLRFAMSPIKKMDASAERYFHMKMKEYYDEIAEDKDKIHSLTKPSLLRYSVNDATIEAVTKRHSVNKRGLLLYMDEMKGFFANFTRYGKGSDQQQWLSNFSGVAFQKDRVDDEKSISIPNPHITIMGGIQPEVYKQVFTKDFVNDGMADRFLVFKPERKEIKQRKIDRTKKFDFDVEELWNEIVKRIYEIPLENEPHILQFTKEAEIIFDDWYNNSFKFEESDVIASIDAKIQTYCARFCLILQISKDVFREGGFRMEVDGESVQNAIKLAEFFKRKAKKMRLEAEFIDPVEILMANEYELFHLLPDEFTTGEGQKIAEDSELMKDTTFRTKFLKNKDLFEKVSNGNWRKIKKDGSKK